MSAGRPRKYHRPETITGRIPGHKKDILDILKITPTVVINTGVNVAIESAIHQEKVSFEALDLYIYSIDQEISELQEKKTRAEKVKKTFTDMARREQEQITVYDLDTLEKITIRRSEYVKEKHAMIAEERA